MNWACSRAAPPPGDAGSHQNSHAGEAAAENRHERAVHDKSARHFAARHPGQSPRQIDRDQHSEDTARDSTEGQAPLSAGVPHDGADHGSEARCQPAEDQTEERFHVRNTMVRPPLVAARPPTRRESPGACPSRRADSRRPGRG